MIMVSICNAGYPRKERANNPDARELDERRENDDVGSGNTIKRRPNNTAMVG